MKTSFTPSRLQDGSGCRFFQRGRKLPFQNARNSCPIKSGFSPADVIACWIVFSRPALRAGPADTA